MSFPYSEIEQKLQYVFRNKGLLETAFTHSTYANAHGREDNERLEYLGDAVLQLVVTQWQYISSGAQEGELTKQRQKLVCEAALFSAVERLDIKRYLLISGGKENVGKKTVSSLLETVIAAIYLDGGFDAAKKFIERNLLRGKSEKEENPKGDLQEFLQRKGEQLPLYTCQKSGMDNAPVFVCEAAAMGKIAHGKGKSKRQAEQNAAKALLQALKS